MLRMLATALTAGVSAVTEHVLDMFPGDPDQPVPVPVAMRRMILTRQG